MAARKERWGKKGKRKLRWIVDFVMRYPDGTAERIREQSEVQTKAGAEEWERDRRQQLLDEWKANKLGLNEPRKEVPTFAEWWSGRFWRKWVVARDNSEGEMAEKKTIYRLYLEPHFGHLRLDEIIEGGYIQNFKAFLVEQIKADKFGKKRANNILAPLSTALRHAEAQRVVDRAPRVGLYKVDPPEIVWWEFSEYARILLAARTEGAMWLVAVCLAGEAGLRTGEVRALVWERDIDLIGATITVNKQTRKGRVGPPKGRRSRKVPMTPTLLAALKALPVVRRGLVIRDDEGNPIPDEVAARVLNRICRTAGLAERGWHVPRHANADENRPPSRR
jgi:integrase